VHGPVFAPVILRHLSSARLVAWWGEGHENPLFISPIWPNGCDAGGMDLLTWLVNRVQTCTKRVGGSGQLSPDDPFPAPKPSRLCCAGRGPNSMDGQRRQATWKVGPPPETPYLPEPPAPRSWPCQGAGPIPRRACAISLWLALVLWCQITPGPWPTSLAVGAEPLPYSPHARCCCHVGRKLRSVSLWVQLPQKPEGGETFQIHRRGRRFPGCH